MNNNELFFQKGTVSTIVKEINQGIKDQLNEFKEEVINSSPMNDKLLTREETSEFLKIDLSTLYNWTKQGRVKAYGIANRRYYKLSEILESLKPLKIEKL